MKDAEVIIVGAGPSGLTAAKVLSDAKVETIVLEKEKTSSKNFYSGIVCSKPLGDIFPSFWEIAQIERKITTLRTYILGRDVACNVSTTNGNLYFNVLRGPFLNSLVETHCNASLRVLRGEIVRSLIIEKHKVIGVETENKSFYSDMVIIAEGASGILTKKEGFRKGEILKEEIFLFVEESFSFLPETIERKFDLKPGEGTGIKFHMDFFTDVKCIGHLNTNKNSISLGTGILFSDSVLKKININDCHEKLKEHPLIKTFIDGGDFINYSSYIVPVRAPQWGAPTLNNGCVVVGAAAGHVNPMDFDISKECILNAKMMAETIIGVKK